MPELPGLPDPRRLLRRGPEAISPTAHYTGETWARNGLSHEELRSVEGRLMFESLRLPMGVSGALGGPTLEAFLMARHIKLDELLRKAIDTGRVGQVVEVAAGLSPRGWRFSSRYGAKIDYVEADLAGMARRKREALGRMDALGPHHRVAELNALEDEGPLSLAALVEELDPDRGLAIVTEGLLPYFPREEVKGMWRRFAEAIGRFPSGVYLSDIHINSIETGTATAVRRALIGAFVRGRVFTNFDDEKDAIAALKRAGFTRAKLHRASDQEGAGARMVRILEAS